jgi:hypothetical protein
MRGERNGEVTLWRGRDPRRVDKNLRPEKAPSTQPKRYDILFFDTLQAAKAAKPDIESKAQGVDQLNLVIRAEANMDDPELATIPHVKVFAGAAWALIHDRRKEEGWYDAPR